MTARQAPTGGLSPCKIHIRNPKIVNATAARVRMALAEFDLLQWIAGVLLAGHPSQCRRLHRSLTIPWKCNAVNVVKTPPFEKRFTGYGVYLGQGMVLTAVHVAGHWPFFTHRACWSRARIFQSSS